MLGPTFRGAPGLPGGAAAAASSSTISNQSGGGLAAGAACPAPSSAAVRSTVACGEAPAVGLQKGKAKSNIFHSGISCDKQSLYRVCELQKV